MQTSLPDSIINAICVIGGILAIVVGVVIAIKTTNNNRAMMGKKPITLKMIFKKMI